VVLEADIVVETPGIGALVAGVITNVTSQKKPRIARIVSSMQFTDLLTLKPGG
jgi:hypothetical protein